MKKLIGLILCLLNIHDYTISKWTRYKDIKCKHIGEEGFDRCCERCNKQQRLERPKEYHPIKYIWTTKNGNR